MSGLRVVLKDTKGWGDHGIGGKYPFGYIAWKQDTIKRTIISKSFYFA